MRAAFRRLIHVRPTPNPLAREFRLPGKQLFSAPDIVLRFQPSNLPMKDLEAVSPLAAKLVSLEHVSEILLTSEGVTVNVDHGAYWEDVTPRVTKIVQNALNCGPVTESAMHQLAELAGGNASAVWPDCSVEADIVDILEMHIRPHVREDGGDIRFHGFDHESGMASVQLVGACSGCPSSASTLKGRVEVLLRHYVPEVTRVEAISEEEAAAAAGASSKREAPLGGEKASIEEHIAPLPCLSFTPPPLPCVLFTGEKVSIEEHIARMMAEGAATSFEWLETQRRPLQ